MEKLKYDGLVEEWKVDLIAARARRMGFRWDEIPDIQQRIIMEVLAFEFDESNGAKESTALQAIIDNNLKKMCRTTARYRSHLERLVHERPLETDFIAEECAIDVRLAVAQLPEREQTVCQALAAGCSKHEIAQRLQCGWHTVDRLILRIREHFRDIGLDGYVISETN